MTATWRTFPEWPYSKRPQPKPSQFKTTYQRSLQRLEEEIGRVGGKEVVIGVVCTPDQLTYGGFPKANFKVLYRGVEVSFEREGQRLAFRTDTYPLVHDNIHAIALTLEALRAVDRYGATSGAEQYQGFQLASGGPDPERGRQLVAEAGSIATALKRHHPDHKGDPRAFADVQAYRTRAGDS